MYGISKIYQTFLFYSFAYFLIKTQVKKILAKQCMKKNGLGSLVDDDWSVEQYIKKTIGH